MNQPPAKGDFTLDDFRKQLGQLAQLGGMGAHMPGINEMIPEGEEPDVVFRRIQGMIDAMTKAERRNPDVIDTSRRRRIAMGSGAEPHEIKQFLGQFDQVRTLMQQMASLSTWQRLKRLLNLGNT